MKINRNFLSIKRLRCIDFSIQDIETLIKIDRKCFPFDEECDYYKSICWFLYYKEKPIGYISLNENLIIESNNESQQDVVVNNVAEIYRVGILHKYRENQLGLFLLRQVVRYCIHKKNIHYIATYTSYDNYPSINNLIKLGFKVFENNNIPGFLSWYKSARKENSKEETHRILKTIGRVYESDIIT